MKAKYFWIKERHNPQTGTYYVKYGRISAARAKKMEKALYGDNYMLRFDTEEAYNAKIEELKKAGERVLEGAALV